MRTLLAQHILLAAHFVHVAGAGLLILLILLAAALFVGALITITTSGLSAGMKLVWIVFACIAPFLGSLLWFVFGRGDAARQRRTA